MFEEANEARRNQRSRKDGDEHEQSYLLLSALFGDLSLEDAIPVYSAPLPSWYAGDPVYPGHNGTPGVAPMALRAGNEEADSFLHHGSGSTFDGFDPLDDTIYDPIDEVGRHLEAEGLTSGQDFYESARRLAPELLHPRGLERCIPGLEAAWPRLRYLINDALHSVDLTFSNDLEESVHALLDEPDRIPSLPNDWSDLLDPYRSEVRRYRVLSGEEQRILGQWVADGRLLHKLRRAINSGRLPDHSRSLGGVAHQVSAIDADLLYAPYSLFVSLLGHVRVLEGEAHSQVGWLTSFTIVGFRSLPEEAYARLEAITGKRMDLLRAELSDLTALCRVLPARVLSMVASALHENHCPPQDLPPDVEWHPLDISNRATAAKRALIRHNLRLALHISYKFQYYWQKLICEQSNEKIGSPEEHGVEETEGLESYSVDADYLGPGFVENRDAEGEIDDEAINDGLFRCSPGHGLDVLDLVQAGNMGLFSAVERWDYAGAAKYSTYSTFWIRQAVLRAIQDHSSRIRIPVHLLDRVLPLLKETRYWPAQMEDKRELLAKGGIEGWQASHAAAALSVLSLDGVTLEAAQAIVDETSKSELSASCEGSEVEGFLQCLTLRQRRVLELRFGLNDGVQRTLEEVGRTFGVTRERIRQIEAKSLSRIRRNLGLAPTIPKREKPDTEQAQEQVSAREPVPS